MWIRNTRAIKDFYSQVGIKMIKDHIPSVHSQPWMEKHSQWKLEIELKVSPK